MVILFSKGFDPFGQRRLFQPDHIADHTAAVLATLEIVRVSFTGTMIITVFFRSMSSVVTNYFVYISGFPKLTWPSIPGRFFPCW